METKEYEISGSLFGGYNKKQTLAYIQALQNMIEELRSEQEKTEAECSRLGQKITEAEGCYKTLWEQYNGQDETIKAQSETIKRQDETIKAQSETIKERDDTIKSQAQTIKGLDDSIKDQAAFYKGLDEAIKSQAESYKGLDEAIKSQTVTIKEPEIVIEDQEPEDLDQDRILYDLCNKKSETTSDEMDKKLEEMFRKFKKSLKKKQKK